MRTTLKHSLAACIALSALMLTGTACTDHDDLRNNAGTQLLALGEVTVAGTQTAATRAANIPGFTGIRKTGFVENDELTLTLSGSATTTAKLVGTTWTLADRTYYTPNTTLTATYTPPTLEGFNPGGIKYADVLTATTSTLPTDGTKLSLTLTHANALIEVTPPADVAGSTYTIAVSATPAATGAVPSPAAEELGIAKEEGATTTDLRYRTIAPADATLSSISLKVNGMAYTTTLTQKVEANKRYPIALSIDKDKLVATVGASDLNWGSPEGFDGRPGGYTRYIGSADELVAFAADVNADTLGTGARKATVLQTADIDLTGREWKPIGTAGVPFIGSYNGNGHTISNLTMTQTGSGSDHIRPGLFFSLVDAKVTGVHLRNCQITSSGVTINAAGALAGYASGSIITLCSATGSISVDVSTNNVYAARVGGLIGWCAGSGGTVTHINRCSADVAVSLNASIDAARCGAFAGYAEKTLFASCIASGKVTKTGSAGSFTGFTNSTDSGECNIYYCITNSDMLQSGTSTLAFASNAIRVMSSIATQSYTNFATLATNHNIKNNVCLGTTASLVGVSVGTSASAVHGKLTDATNITLTTTYGPVKTLHYSKEDGYTLDVVERKWYAADAWKDNGTALPTLNMNYQGMPDAMYGTVYKVNGYYVTMLKVDNLSTRPVWNTDTSAATMDPDPCAAGAANGWRVPTMKDFEAMTGLSTTHPWHQGVDVRAYVTIASDYDNFIKAFPADSYYWSSTPNTNTGQTNTAWRFFIDTNKRVQYSVEDKSHINYVRCVQKQ